MVGCTEPITKADRERFDDMQQACLPCLIFGWPGIPGEIQHVTVAGRRLGHQHTYRSCPYHHRGELGHFENAAAAREVRGPSFALSKRDFVNTFGTEAELVQIQDALIRIIRQVAKRGGYLPRLEIMTVANQLHREIVLQPEGSKWPMNSQSSLDHST